MATKPPIGSCWRILVQDPVIDLESTNYKLIHGKGNMISAIANGGKSEAEKHSLYETGHIFDELAIIFDPDHHNETCLHLEQMNERDWYLGIGDLQFNIHVGEDGALSVMLYGQEETKFEDGR